MDIDVSESTAVLRHVEAAFHIGHWTCDSSLYQAILWVQGPFTGGRKCIGLRYQCCFGENCMV